MSSDRSKTKKPTGWDIKVAAQNLAEIQPTQARERQALRERQDSEITQTRVALRRKLAALRDRHVKEIAEARAAVPTLSNDQWRRVAHLLGTDDAKWRAKINEILEMRHDLSWIQWRNTARKRDLAVIKRAWQLAQQLELLLTKLEAVKVDDILDAAGSCTDRLIAKHLETVSECKQEGRERSLERDLCVGMLADLWNEAKTGSSSGPMKIGDTAGPLVRFLVEAYRPIESLTPQAAREIIRLPRRKSRAFDAMLSRTLLWMDWVLEKQQRQAGDPE
jgi:hypothetical protein